VDLGAADEFNLFACGDYLGLHDAAGKVAAGGDFITSGFSVGSQDPAGAGLIVGGDIDIESGTVFGDVYYGGTLAHTLVNVVGGAFISGTPINFGAECTALKGTANALSGLAVNGTTDITPWGAITLTGTDPVTNVFVVDGSDIDAASSLNINVPAGAAAIITVTGQTVSFSSMGLGGIDAMRTLWNLPEATSLTITSVYMQGTVLAPKASTVFDNADLLGALIAAEIQGKGQSHLAPLKEISIDPCVE